MDHPVPNITTALTGSLQELEQHFLQNQNKIETWFRHQWLETPPPFYASVDLRNSGHKIAPVDTNLFPAGFNNLNNDFIPLCVHAIQTAIEHVCPAADKVLIIPENHTRNLKYFESIATLCEIIEKSGFDVRIGSLIEDLDESTEYKLESGRTVTLDPIIKNDNKISTIDGFTPCMLLLNNDFSGGCPEIFNDITQKIIPPTQLSWAFRLKSDHFQHYQSVSKELSEIIDVDPWLFNPLFKNCGELNFLKREGEDCLADFVNTLIQEIQVKYDQYNIDKKPFVIIKADAGTYGMGVMTVHSGADIYELNRKQRNKMSSLKEGKKITKVIVQEGVYTFETWGDNQAPAEPVVYMIDRFVVGGFYRVHAKRKSNENLNAPGMEFQPLAFADPGIVANQPNGQKHYPNRFYAYGVVARLALLAAAKEIQLQTMKN